MHRHFFCTSVCQFLGEWTHINCKNAGNFMEMQSTHCSSAGTLYMKIYGEIYTLCDNNNSNIFQLLHWISVQTQIFACCHKLIANSELFECNKSHVTQFGCEYFVCWKLPADKPFILLCVCVCVFNSQQKIVSHI